MPSRRVHLGINAGEVRKDWKGQSTRQNANLERVSALSVAKGQEHFKEDTGTTCMEHSGRPGKVWPLAGQLALTTQRLLLTLKELVPWRVGVEG